MRFSTLLVLVPAAVAATLFALANRQEVVVAFVPFAGEGSPLSLTMPLFLLAFLSLFLGVLLGGATVALSRRARGRRLKARDIGSAIAAGGDGKPGAENSKP